ncbi:protein of unknown function [Microbacterium sp. ru370.1]|uniref:DUF3863 domain-containing protein n=1 Tax=unclassified Microbacterium TaxID=2609290 RepID=UPI000884D63E|nr:MULTISPECIES: DUF3863 domain-containing protein [unclassified Microbacterium]SDO41185.1 protein of unknown function [Microbacterium sp. ru370.1]SIT79748.1 protein of unknown function [Microbacterium sp. RU1D]
MDFPSTPIGRRLTINTIVRRHQIEATRDRSLWEDETPLHSAALVERFSDAVRDAVPDASLTWALSWGALTDDSPRYRDIRRTLARIAADHDDDVTFVPGGFFANLYGTRDDVARDISDAVDLLHTHFDRPTTSLVAGFLSADNIAAARDLGIRSVQGNIWSQFDIDLQDGDGSLAYPYYPSRRNFLVPGRGDDRIDAVQLDGWTVDLVAARGAGMSTAFNSRLGLGPIETLHRLPREDALRELHATSEAHLNERNVERNGLGWLTVNYEISEVARGLDHDPTTLDAWAGWLRGLRERWSDLEVTTIGRFGEEWRQRHPDNQGLAYLLEQTGSGVQGSTAGETVTWFMGADFRLGVVRAGDDVDVFDYTAYADAPGEPQQLGDRRWSLLGEINQKQTRPQDRPVPLGRFLSTHPEVEEALDATWGAAPELAALRVTS